VSSFVICTVVTKYYPGSELKKSAVAGHVARARKCRGVYRNLANKPEGNKSLAKPKRMWENNLKIDGEVS